MMEVYKVIVLKKKIIILRWVIIAMFIISVSFINDSRNSVYIGIWLIFLLVVLIYLCFVRSYINYGEIKFQQKNIEVISKREIKCFVIEKVKKLHIIFNGYQGQRINHLINSFHLDIDRKEGINKLKIYYEGEKFIFRFIVRNRKDFESLQECILKYRHIGINVKIKRVLFWN